MLPLQVLVLVLSLLLPATFAAHVRVSISNHLGEQLQNLQCRSADNQIYNMPMEKEQSVAWEFNTRVIGKTLFFCHAEWGPRRVHFDAYDQTLDGKPGSVNWDIYQDGFAKTLGTSAPNLTAAAWPDPSVEAFPPEVECGRFKHTCDFVDVDGALVRAICRSIQGRQVKSMLDLNDYLGNQNGHLLQGRGFAESCFNSHFDISPQHQSILATCKTGWDGIFQDTKFFLENHLNNKDGVLEWCW